MNAVKHKNPAMKKKLLILGAVILGLLAVNIAVPRKKTQELELGKKLTKMAMEGNEPITE